MVELLIKYCYSFILAILQKYYISQKLKKIKQRRKDGVDPIKTAFEQMKVETWELFIFCFNTG